MYYLRKGQSFFKLVLPTAIISSLLFPTLTGAQIQQKSTVKEATKSSSIPVVKSSNKSTHIIKIGGRAEGPTLTGANLDKVLKVVLVKPGTNTIARGFVLRKSVKGNGKYLRIAIEARKSASPGFYRIQLQYGKSPIQSEKQKSVYKITLSKRLADIKTIQMVPRVSGFKPFTGCKGASCSSVRARDKLAKFITVISNIPGNKVVSILRLRPATNHPGFCHYTPWRSTSSSKSKLVEKTTTKFIRPNVLEVTTSQGYFPYKERCYMAFSVRTKNSYNEVFQYYVNHPRDNPNRRVLNVIEGKKSKTAKAENTWEVKKYLKLTRRTANGACSGDSIGPAGSHPVGIRKYKNDIVFRIRSGPIGTTCAWAMNLKPTLKPGWALALSFKDSYLGRTCKITYQKRDLAGGWIESQYYFKRTAYMYFSKEGGHIGSKDPYRILQLSCSPTLSNDNEVSLQITSITVISPPTDAKGRITWKSAFNK